MLLALLVACHSPSPSPSSSPFVLPPVSSSPSQPTNSFELVLIDDSKDRFVVAADAELPAGVTLFEEHATWNLRDGQPSLHGVLLTPQGGESREQALTRIGPWLGGFALPPDARLGWHKSYKRDEPDKPVFQGWYSCVLRGPAVITATDIASVAGQPDAEGGPRVTIQLTAPGAERLRVATRDHVKQRMAIIFEGLVTSAPIIMSEIAGGKVQILLGEGDGPAEVDRLVEKLTPPSRAGGAK